MEVYKRSCFSQVLDVVLGNNLATSKSADFGALAAKAEARGDVRTDLSHD
jgi:hypothetical protein